MSDSAFPTINLDDTPDSGEIVRACRETGCFNVSDSGVSKETTLELLGRMDEFFGLPDDHPIKLAVHRDKNECANGWTPMLGEPAYEQGTIAWVESFDCVLSRQSLAKVAPEIRATARPTRWPEIDGFRESARMQWDDLILIARKLYPLVSDMLRRESGFLAERASSQVLNTLRLLNYPPRPSIADDVCTGIAAHTDFECITLIQQTAPGLEVKTPNGKWRQVPVAPGQWTVLMGDVMERWSNGYFKATPHRVPVTSWPRKSIVKFIAADAELEISPLEEFVGKDHPPAYQPVTQDKLINTAMARAEANRQEMLPQAEKLRAGISPD